MTRGGTTMSAERLCALRRVALPAIGGCLALLALSLPAQGQPPRAGAMPKLRIMSISTPPLAGPRLPGGGLVMALVNASLTLGGGGPESDVRWTTEALTEQALTDASVDLVLPIEGADCDRPNELTPVSAVVCDHAVYSDPILQVVIGLFSLSNRPLKFETDEGILGKTVCLFREQDLSVLNANGRNWASYKRLTVLRRSSLLDCVVAVQAHDADAFVAIDLQGRHLLRRLGLTRYFVMHTRPLATRGVHAVVSREHIHAADIIDTLNRGLKRLKQDDTYSAIVQKHLMTAAAAVTAASRPSAGSLPQGMLPDAPAATRPAALPPAALRPAALPVLDAAGRKTALRFLKRGDEELADGRVAPARLLYERAADMGLAPAAMALAGTYDARELNKPQLRSVLPDAAEAKRWYERARALGAADAGARLQRLGSK